MALKKIGCPVVKKMKSGSVKARKYALIAFLDNRYPVNNAIRMGSIKYSGNGKKCDIAGKR
jgi:hypothetical protein